jgi:hypothetical protein
MFLLFIFVLAYVANIHFTIMVKKTDGYYWKYFQSIAAAYVFLTLLASLLVIVIGKLVSVVY